MSYPTSTIARLDAISDYLPYLAIGVAIYGIVVLAVYVWYAAALSRVFAKLGAAPWKAWVPIVNEAELLTRGGVPGWSVVYLFIPLLNIYGLVLHIQAVHRINVQFGRGAGLTVLNLLVPPVWATVLAMANGSAQGADIDRRVASAAVSSTGTGPLSATSATTTTGASVPPMAPSSLGAPAAPVSPVAQAAPSPALVVETPTPVAAPAQKVESTGGLIVNPWAPAPTAPDVAAVVPAPIAPLPSVAPAVVGQPAVAPSIPVMPVDPSPVTVAEEVAEEDDDDDFETVVVDRRPKTTWSLVLDDGRSFALTAETVALGRKPTSAEPAVQLLAIEDSTKTLSKTHALLRSTDDTWTILDLDSTNGVLTVGDDGAETLLPAGGSTQVDGRFLLGKVGMRVRADQETP
jgi:hypothetical protein